MTVSQKKKPSSKQREKDEKAVLAECKKALDAVDDGELISAAQIVMGLFDRRVIEPGTRHGWQGETLLKETVLCIASAHQKLEQPITSDFFKLLEKVLLNRSLDPDRKLKALEFVARSPLALADIPNTKIAKAAGVDEKIIRGWKKDPNFQSQATFEKCWFAVAGKRLGPSFALRGVIEGTYQRPVKRNA